MWSPLQIEMGCDGEVLPDEGGWSPYMHFYFLNKKKKNLQDTNAIFKMIQII